MTGTNPPSPAGEGTRHWYRPAQICAPSYGKAIRFFQITRLDESSYEEVDAGELLPNWKKGLTGTHTINCDAGLTVIDVQRRVSRLGAIFGAIGVVAHLAGPASVSLTDALGFLQLAACGTPV